MAASYYVYYRVEPAKMPACVPIAREVLADVSRSTGVTGRLLRKRGEPNLWMEVYEGVIDAVAFEAALAAAADRFDLPACLLPGTRRHVECFDDDA